MKTTIKFIKKNNHEYLFLYFVWLFLGVGKTCLLLRYANDSFSPTFITTIGIDFKIKNISIDGKRIKLQVRFCQNKLCISLFLKGIITFPSVLMVIIFYKNRREMNIIYICTSNAKCLLFNLYILIYTFPLLLFRFGILLAKSDLELSPPLISVVLREYCSFMT